MNSLVPRGKSSVVYDPALDSLIWSLLYQASPYCVIGLSHPFPKTDVAIKTDSRESRKFRHLLPFRLHLREVRYCASSKMVSSMNLHVLLINNLPPFYDYNNPGGIRDELNTLPSQWHRRFPYFYNNRRGQSPAFCGHCTSSLHRIRACNLCPYSSSRVATPPSTFKSYIMNSDTPVRTMCIKPLRGDAQE